MSKKKNDLRRTRDAIRIANGLAKVVNGNALITDGISSISFTEGNELDNPKLVLEFPLSYFEIEIVVRERSKLPL